VDEISSLVQDIENIRMDRLRNSVKEMAKKFVNKETNFGTGDSISAKIPNCSSLEIQAVKKFVTESMAVWSRLEEPVETNDSERLPKRSLGKARSLRR